MENEQQKFTKLVCLWLNKQGITYEISFCGIGSSWRRDWINIKSSSHPYITVSVIVIYELSNGCNQLVYRAIGENSRIKLFPKDPEFFSKLLGYLNDEVVSIL